LKTQAKPQGFKHRLGSAESPAEARHWAPTGRPTERPDVDFEFGFRIGHPKEVEFSKNPHYLKVKRWWHGYCTYFYYGN